MIGIPTKPGTWQRELERSRQSLSAVNRFWHGLYGKAVLCPTQVLPPAAKQQAATTPPEAPPESMSEHVGSQATDA